MNLIETLALLSSGGLCLRLLDWLRYHHTDRANRQKTLAETVRIKANAELRIGEAWMAIAEELQEQLRDALKRITGLEEAIRAEQSHCDRKMDALRRELMAATR